MSVRGMHSPLLKIFNTGVHFVMWGMVVTTIVFWSKIPNHVPKHYGYGGVADSYGEKTILIPIILVAFFVYLMHLFLVYGMPGLMDAKQLFGEKAGRFATVEEAHEGLDIVLRMIAVLDLFSIGLCGYISYCIASVKYLGKMFEPIIFFGYGIAIIYYIYRFLQKRNEIENIHKGEESHEKL